MEVERPLLLTSTSAQAGPSVQLGPAAAGGAELVPDALNAAATGYGVVVEPDRLTVRYTGDARHNNDVGAVQANRPVPRQRLVFYFELRVVDAGKSGKIAIGFTEKQFKLNRQPGWEPGSYGYHGDDGKKFYQSGVGEDYGPRFGAGDVVGAGIHLSKQEIFFSKNGVKLQTAFRNVRAVLYPTIGLHSKGECVEVNFGSKPFRFDLEGMIAEERTAQQAQINRIDLPPSAALQLVFDYLRHSGYANTLQALQAEVGDLGALGPALPDGADTPAAVFTAKDGAVDAGGAAMVTDGDASWLAVRQRVRLAILRGDVEAALADIQAACPQLLSDHPGHAVVQYQLHSQQFIELVRQGRVPQALDWAHASLEPLRARLPSLEAALREVVALLAYVTPQESPLSHLLSQAHRQEVAEAVNGALLAAAAGLPPGTAPHPAGLVRVVQQVVEVHAALLESVGGQGEPFRLQDVLPPQEGSGPMQTG